MILFSSGKDMSPDVYSLRSKATNHATLQQTK